ncbi:MAG: DUF456 domain-containing protein [Nocardioidaceae bacterium]|nr:DUF456 domain-containing protein [Nocardioidaceae bacterium]
MSGLDVLVGLLIALGLVGILVPMLPGSLLVGAAIGVWAAERAEASGWVVFAVAAALLVAGAVVRYLVPGRRLQRSGVPNRTLLAGGLLGVAGFFVVPVVGLPLGFVLGVYLAEWHRTTHREAWPATVSALKAVGLGILVELAFATAAAAVWAVGVVVA